MNAPCVQCIPPPYMSVQRALIVNAPCVQCVPPLYMSIQRALTVNAPCVEERTNAGAIHRRLRRQLTNYRVPDVMEYVQEKADLYELKKNVRSWNRKVEIAEVAKPVVNKPRTALSSMAPALRQATAIQSLFVEASIRKSSRTTTKLV